MKYGKILVTIFVAAAANSFPYIDEPYGGKFSADGAKVAYVSGAAGGPYIYTANADGTGKVKFELEGGLWGEPYFSPDGSKIAFVNDDEFFGNRNIFLVDVDGANLRPVTAYGDDPYETAEYYDLRIGVLDVGLTFSPDGRTVLYISEELGTKDIFAINVDGTGKKRLTDFDGWEGMPVFLPGRDKILFVVSAGEGKSGIWIMNADGSGKKKLLAAAYPFRVAVSPDAKKISYVESRINISESILYWVTYVADLDGRFMLAGEDGESTNQPGSFSPDGKKVLCDVGDRIYVVNADGTGRKNLTPGWYYVSKPAFFADGAKIAFVGSRRPGSLYNIYTMDADGSNLKLFKATECVDPMSSVVVSPTGDRFLFRNYYVGTDAGGGDYFVVNADGSGLVRLSEYNPPPYDEEEE